MQGTGVRTIGPATEAHERHMAQLKRLNRSDERREYIANVRRAEGGFYAKWLEDDYAQWWADNQKKRQQSK